MAETATAVLEELASLGTEQTRKTYRRHGITGEQFGVSYANLGKLTRRIKRDHDLALALWASGNHDARILATMIADPAQTDEAMLDAWAGDLANYIQADALADLAARTPHARSLAERWSRSDDECTARAAWHLLARLAGAPDGPDDAYFDRWLAEIRDDIHARPNRVREAMNNALIAIGVRGDRLEHEALAIAAAIGPVDVDHGETACKTPDAAAYIRKTLDRRRAKQAAAVA
jgi:3-methyladenine DNA glycosylase AlkD